MLMAITNLSQAQEASIREQLRKMLASRHFSQSRRYPALLRYTVEAALRGETSGLHERLIGHLLFQRPADYDTTNDPVVRMTAAEVRKRVAQFYHESNEQEDVIIRFSPGSYIPEFVPASQSPVRPERAAAVEDAPLDPAASSEQVSDTLETRPTKSATPFAEVPPATPPVHARTTWWMAGSGLLLCCLLIVVVVGYRLLGTPQLPAALSPVWGAVFPSTLPVTISLGQLGPGIAAFAKDHARATDVNSDLMQDYWLREAISVSDTRAMSSLINLLIRQRQSYRIQTSSEMTFNQLRDSPCILLGAMDNEWTMKELQDKRFYFDPLLPHTILDRKNPSSRSLSLQLLPGHKDVNMLMVDYAVAARIFDPSSGQPVLIAAGLNGSGTRAAAEFLTSEKALAAFAQSAPKGWERKNFEVVVRTEVFNNIPGTPTVVGQDFW